MSPGGGGSRQAPLEIPFSLQPVSDTAIQYLVLDLVSGIDGAGYALDQAGVGPSDPVVTIFFEADLGCRRVLQKHRVNHLRRLSLWKDESGLEGSALAIIEKDCALLKDHLQTFPNLKSILVIGGFPCQDHSRANTSRKNLSLIHI